MQTLRTAIVALVASLMLGSPGGWGAPVRERVPAPGPAWAAARLPGRAGGAKLPRGLRVGSYQRASLKRLLAAIPSPVDSLKILVLRASFADTSIASSHDSLYFANELRHLSEYYLGASLGRFHAMTTLAPGIVTLSHPEAYYGNDDLWAKRMAEMLIELVEKTDARIDFSKYDAFAVIHADAGQETDFNGDSPNQVWSGFVSPEEMAEALKDTLDTSGVPTNDLLAGSPFSIDNLMIWPEDASQDGQTFGSLGIYAYQLALRIGMLPLFDSTPSGFPDSQGIGTFDLTSYGLYNAAGFIPAFPSAFNRYLMGWVQAVTIDGDASVRLVDIGSAAPTDTALVKIPISASEYFLVDNRVHDTNFNGRFDFIDLNGNGFPENEDTLRGAEFDFFLTATTDLEENGKRVTGSGVMVWHVDEGAIRRALASDGNPNDDRSWKGVDLEEADHVQDMDKPGGLYSFGSHEDSFRKGNNDLFSPDTDPSSASNAGLRTGIEISDISEAGHVMSLHVRVAPAVESKRVEIAGDAEGLSPIPADLDGDGSEELVIAADTGLIYVALGAGSRIWDGVITRIAKVDSALWSGPPVVVDLNGDHVPEIFVTSRTGTLYAFEPTGEPYAIDTDGTPGSLKLRGDRASAPIAFNFDDRGRPEVLVLSSTADSTYATVFGLSELAPKWDWVHVGSGGLQLGLKPGRLMSHPAGARLDNPIRGSADGVYYVTSSKPGTAEFQFFIPYIGPISLARAQELEAVAATFAAGDSTEGFLALAAGDVDRDGWDELVTVVPEDLSGAGNQLVYFSPFCTPPCEHFASLRGSHPSSPVLADLNGDGILETALRDDSFLYLFTGFGAPVSGWPIRIDDRIVQHDSSTFYAPPVIGDINNDGHIEIVFRIAGDLHAFDFSGREVAGWPLLGEGTPGGSLALLNGAGFLYVLDAASFPPVSRTSVGSAAPGVVTALNRRDPGVPSSSVQTWPFFRHDAGGSGREPLPQVTSIATERIDPSTFIVYPNPASGSSVTFRVLITAPSEVKVRVFTIEGETVFSATRTHPWSNGSTVPFEETIPTSKLSSGVYVCHLEVSGDGWSWKGSKKFAVTR